MKRILLLLALFAAPFCIYADGAKVPETGTKNPGPAVSASSGKNYKLPVSVFYSPHCKVCMELEKEFFPAVKEKYKDKVAWEDLDTANNSANLTRLVTLSIRLKNDSGHVPSVLIGDTLLVGRDEIKTRLSDTIELALKQRKGPLGFMRIELLQVFKKISVFTVIASGLIDGINPCAFAVIVFFVSFLAVYGYRKREIIYVGASYCIAVFLTYLLIGLGFFNFLYSLSNFYSVIKIFYYFIAAFCFVLSGLALYDFFKFKTTKQTDGLILQLPHFFKKRINEIIGSHLRKKHDEGALSLSISAFVVGFFVSLLEGACTGQVYLPTIVLILKNTNLRALAFSYLVVYNLMFILPLIVVFVLSLLGFSSQKFNNFLKTNMSGIKLLMFLLFFLLGLVILWIS
jgi:cytochrome c biogenesis protein CcdA